MAFLPNELIVNILFPQRQEQTIKGEAEEQ